MTATLAVRAAILLALALTGVALMRRQCAAARHAVLASAFLVILILPMARFAPAWQVQLPSPERAPVLLRDLGASFLIRLAGGEGVLERQDRRDTGALFTWMWIAGCVVFGLRTALTHVAAQRVVRRATARGGISSSSEIATPMAVGIFIPRIVVPASFEEWPPDDRRSVLAHESAHVLRRDPLIQLLAQSACCLYWFNPLVWMASARLRLECERACDDRVVRDGHDRDRYAAVLVHVASRAARGPVAAVPMSRPSELEQRVIALFDECAARSAVGNVTRAGIVTVTLLIAIPIAAISPAAARRIVDPYLDPLTEQVAGFRDTVPAVALTSLEEEHVIATLRAAAGKTPTWRGDLVADRARWALARVENGRIVEPMIRALDHEDWRVRGYAAWTLAIAGDSRATASLMPLLTRPVWRERAAAAFALHQIADPRAARAMELALDDEAWQVRMEAVAYFAAIGDRQRVKAMDSDPHVAVRMTVAQALNE